MSKILYIVDDNKKSDYKYEIEEDTIIYHYSINSSSNVEINLASSAVPGCKGPVRPAYSAQQR